MSHSLAGKVVLITGSTSGIELGLAQSLAAEGADIGQLQRTDFSYVQVFGLALPDRIFLQLPASAGFARATKDWHSRCIMG